jgi:succinate dehydrogenase / fumarate reductase flavoprotein subunit
MPEQRQGQGQAPEPALASDRLKMQVALGKALGIFRERAALEAGLEALEGIPGNLPLLARALVQSALAREESRGAHSRLDFPDRDDGRFRKTTVAQFDGESISVRFADIPAARNYTRV